MAGRYLMPNQNHLVFYFWWCHNCQSRVMQMSNCWSSAMAMSHCWSCMMSMSHSQCGNLIVVYVFCCDCLSEKDFLKISPKFLFKGCGTLFLCYLLKNLFPGLKSWPEVFLLAQLEKSSSSPHAVSVFVLDCGITASGSLVVSRRFRWPWYFTRWPS